MESEQKQTKTLLSEDQLLQVVDPQTRCCIWLTDEPLSSREKPLTWFNYLFDGVVESQLARTNQNQKTSLFVTNNYGNKFYLVHRECEKLEQPQKITDHLNLIKESLPDNTKILLLSKNSKVFSEKDLKKLSHLEFQKLIY